MELANLETDTTFFVTHDNLCWVFHDTINESGVIKYLVYNTQDYIANVKQLTQLKCLQFQKIRSVFSFNNVTYTNYLTQLLNALQLDCASEFYEDIVTIYNGVDLVATAEIYNDITDLLDRVKYYIDNIIEQHDNDITFQDFCRHFYDYYFRVYYMLREAPSKYWLKEIQEKFH